MAETGKEEKAKVIEEYKELNNQQANVVMLFYNIAEEKRQHEYFSAHVSLVLEALKTSNPDYRAWRIRNGVLVETVVKEAIPDIEKDIQKVIGVMRVACGENGEGERGGKEDPGADEGAGGEVRGHSEREGKGRGEEDGGWRRERLTRVITHNHRSLYAHCLG